LKIWIFSSLIFTFKKTFWVLLIKIIETVIRSNFWMKIIYFSIERYLSILIYDNQKSNQIFKRELILLQNKSKLLAAIVIFHIVKILKRFHLELIWNLKLNQKEEMGRKFKKKLRDNSFVAWKTWRFNLEYLWFLGNFESEKIIVNIWNLKQDIKRS
jgi:hypothetical protein